MIAAVIEAELSGVKSGQDITIEDIVDASMPAEEIIDELDLETEDGEAAMESILEKVREITASYENDEVPVEEDDEPVEEDDGEEEEITDEVADEADDESVETDEATIEVADEEDI